MIVLETVIQDIRYGVRMLWRNPGFTAVATLALALGIGVNTAAFTAYKAFFERALDARDPGQLVNLALVTASGETSPNFSYPDYLEYRDKIRSFQGVIAEPASIESLAISGVDGIVSQNRSAGSLIGKLGLLPSITRNTETAIVMTVSENYFSVLGVNAVRGRTFQAGDDRSLAASPAVLISENYWQRRFAGDPATLGKTLRLNGAAVTIIGITPHNFIGTTVIAPDFWIPIGILPLIHPENNWLADRENASCRLFARLASGVGISQAQAEMTALARHLRALHDPQSELAKPSTALVWPGSPFPIPIQQNRAIKFAVLFLMIAVGMVLVIACANVASLQLARAASRQNELCMRLSLGASRKRIIRQLLTECSLLGMLAGTVGFLASWAFLQIAVTFASEFLPAELGTLVFHVNPDLETFLYVSAISLGAGILFGLAPALESSRTALRVTTGTPAVRSRRLRDALIAAQVGFSVMLMIAGSMLIRSARNTLTADTGYDVKHGVSLDLEFPEGSKKYTSARRNAVVRQLRARLAALPSVKMVTNGRAPDNQEGLRTAAISLNGEKPSPQNTQAILYYTYVEPNYFQTLGIPLLLGRGFQSQVGEPERSVILSESSAEGLWPGQSPIGRTLRLGTDNQFHLKTDAVPDSYVYQVIGVARDTSATQINGSDVQQVYLPMPEDRVQDFPMVIQTNSDPSAFASAIGPILSSVDPDLVASSITLEQLLRTNPPFLIASLAAAVASAVGIFGLLLASTGIYGTVSYLVALRTREIGIRMAIGAQKRDVISLILRESSKPVLAGLLIGMLLATGVAHLLHNILFGLGTVDAVSYAAVSLFFLAVALLATYPPARRATRVDPMVALRYD